MVNDEDAISEIVDGRWLETSRPKITVVNEQLRRSYIEDCAKGMRRWNRILEEHGIEYRLDLPNEAFHRQVGIYRDAFVAPSGEILSESDWESSESNFLPTDSDRDFVISLMQPVYAPGQMASWIAPPMSGIHTQPIDYEYVRL